MLMLMLLVMLLLMMKMMLKRVKAWHVSLRASCALHLAEHDWSSLC